jgi:hypothetical protein
MTNPPGPERFGDIVQRLFPRLKEPRMPQPVTIASAEDHYRTICRLLTEAEVHPHNLAEVHALVERVAGHRHAAELALQLWPADAAGVRQ